MEGENPDIEIDLRGANLANADLSNTNFFQVDLSEANLTRPISREAISCLRNKLADLSGANLSLIISQDTVFEELTSGKQLCGKPTLIARTR